MAATRKRVSAHSTKLRTNYEQVVERAGCRRIRGVADRGCTEHGTCSVTRPSGCPRSRSQGGHEYRQGCNDQSTPIEEEQEQEEQQEEDDHGKREGFQLLGHVSRHFEGWRHQGIGDASVI